MNITVSQLVGYIKRRFDQDPNLQGLLVQGEISNYRRQLASGHLYFTLKDEHAQISCVMFRSSASTLKFEPKNGDKVIVSARASVFEQSGSMQLYVNSMKLDGLGDLFVQYEMLKRKLGEEGYFSSEHKKQLKSKYPEKVAVLVGDHSAAMSDIKTCFARRWPLAEVTYYPVLVQGAGASEDIINNLLKADEEGYDAIILARGGGSFEDLFEFNNENLVKTIFQLKTFIVTGIGHEQDFTLSDFVSDLRAPTPTACVELITVDIKDVAMKLEELSHSECFVHPESIFESKQMMLDYYSSKLLALSRMFEKTHKEIANLENRMISSLKISIETRSFENERCILRMKELLKNSLLNSGNEMERMKREMNYIISSKYKECVSLLEKEKSLLDAYNKDNVLKRGYTLIYSDGHYIKTANELTNKNIEIEFIDGRKKARIED